MTHDSTSVLSISYQRIYDLWQGTIQSQDGALQLLLIVDYIWSWARDVYRPSIRDALFNDITGSRELSPASTDRFRTSVSLSSVSNSAPSSQTFVSYEVDRLIATERSSRTPFIRDSQELCHPQEQAATIPNVANSHPFLKWAAGHELSPPWTELGIIRHSDLVLFEFTLHVISFWDISHMDTSQPDDPMNRMLPLSLWLFVEEVYELATLWAGSFDSVPSLAGLQIVHVTLCFHTYCDSLTW